MKKISSLILAGLLLGAVSCKESDFTDSYADPSKIAETTVEKQFTGFLQSTKDYILPGYTNYFVALRTSINHYNQVTGWINDSGQYIPGSSGTEAVWFNYYNMLAQYRELQKAFNALSATDQADRKFFMTVATVYLYDQTERMVDLFGAIPFTEAGMVGLNGGDYANSLAKFDDPQTLYTMMLDDLKSIAAELNATTINAGYLKSFQTQDFVNKGDLTAWKRYTNSLRLRMLNRVSAVSAFQSRSAAEMAEILANTSTYPIVETNLQNIQINVFNVNTDINSKGFQGGIASDGGWYGNTAGKKMIDFMNTNADPRLPILFEPGASAAGKYIGIDPTATSAAQTELSNAGQVAIYNRYVTSHNQFFPGVIINAAEVSLIKSEYYLRVGNDASAKAAYESAISLSTNFYNSIITVSNATGVNAAPSPASESSIAKYIAADGVNWDKATSSTSKLALIATQKWLHFNLVQPYENWAETRRLDLPTFTFQVDNANNQTLPPVKWTIPSNEISYNANNYSAVRDQDKLTTKLFWDVK
ncbi:SusD/RagB family nutrient-binding outer membrane lipoprotein [Dyadobacter sp. CY356]|uniref:SusD/RagB family nutrient-binding outer membrane lipoprotein n=1 Tax=Dyadobacter sp. CY356 TaxID=2906442 RepID=UPI00271534B0|nr:SusD/RagB family nutrient-binding outer membrane lipoprotein [Dyadobacter sp. CY356]